MTPTTERIGKESITHILQEGVDVHDYPTRCTVPGSPLSYKSTINRMEGTLETIGVLVTCDLGPPGSTSSVAQTGTPRHECGSTVSAGDADKQYSTAESATPSDTMIHVCESPVIEKDEECQGSVSNSIKFEVEDADRRSVDDCPVVGGTETDKEGHGNVYHKITSRDIADEQCSSNESPALKDIITPDCDSSDSKKSEPLINMCVTRFRLRRTARISFVQGFP